MVRPLHMGKPSAQLPIPDDWGQALAPVADAMMTATIRVYHPGAEPVLDRNTGLVTEVLGTAVYDGIGSITQAGGVRAQLTAATGQDVTTLEYVVAVSLRVPGCDSINVDDLVSVAANPDDASLTGRLLHVASVVRGSTLWQRDLICVDDLG